MFFAARKNSLRRFQVLEIIALIIFVSLPAQLNASVVSISYQGQIDRAPAGPYSDFGIAGDLGDTFSLELSFDPSIPKVDVGPHQGSERFFYTPDPYVPTPLISIQIGGNQLVLDEGFVVSVDDPGLAAFNGPPAPLVTVTDNHQQSNGSSEPHPIPSGDVWGYYGLIRQEGASVFSDYRTTYLIAWFAFDDQTIGEGEFLAIENSIEQLNFAGFFITTSYATDVALSELINIGGSADLSTLQVVPLPMSLWFFVAGLSGLTLLKRNMCFAARS